MILKQRILALILLSFLVPEIGLPADIDEKKLGFSCDRMMILPNYILIINEPLNRRISEIGNAIANTSGRSDFKYTFRIINLPLINAFSVPGGFVYIFTGLLNILESKDELAAIIAHEIAHINKSHSLNFIYQQEYKKAVGTITGVLLSSLFKTAVEFNLQRNPYLSQDYTFQELTDIQRQVAHQVGWEIAEAITVSMINGYGKKQELEADALAVEYVKNANCDPNALILFFDKLIAIKNRSGIYKKNYVSNLINAEPGLEERIKSLKKLIKKGN